MMKFFDKLKKRDNYDLVSFGLTILLVSLAFSLGNRMFFSDYSIMEGDFYGIYMPFYRLFLNKIFLGNDLFDSGKIFYSAIPGMGMDISAYVACEACFSPFNIFYVIFSNNNIASIFMILFKISTASFFFQRFLRKVFDYTGWYSVFFAASYSMCGYFAAYYFNTQFLEGLYLLPLIMYLVYEFTARNRGVVKLCLAYAYLFIMCFYEAYILGIFSFAFFMLMICFNTEYGVKEKYKKVGKYVCLVIVAFLISAFIILPTAVYVFSNQAADATSDFLYNKNIFNFYGQLFLGMSQDYDGQYPCIYSGILSILLLPAFFCNKNIKKSDKIVWGALLGCLVISCFVKPLYMFWHCFDAPDSFGYRFAFIISFVIIAMAAKALKDKNDADKKVIIISGCVQAVFIIISFAAVVFVGIGEKRQISIVYLILDLVFIAGYMLFFIMGNKLKQQREKYLLIGALISIELCINTYALLAGANHNDLRKNDVLNLIESQLNSAISNVKNSDDGIYRIYLKNSPVINYGTTSNIMNFEMFGSFENTSYRDTMNKLGCMTAPRVTSDTGLNDITQMLFGQKYSIYSYGVNADADIMQPYITENPYALNIGYMVSNNIENVDISSTNVFENQNALIDGMMGKAVNCLKNEPTSISIQVDNVDVEIYDEGGLTLYQLDNTKSAMASFMINSGADNLQAYIPRDDSVIYMGSPRISTVDNNDDRLQLMNYYSAPSIHNLKKNVEGNSILNVLFDAGNAYTNIFIDEILTYSIDSDVFKQVYDDLGSNMLNINRFDDGYVKGVVTATKEKDTLFLSIPYDEHWKLFVDGIEADIHPVLNNTFMGCQLSEGEHDIVLEYKNKYVTLGMIMSIIGMLMLISSMLFERKNSKK